MCATIRERIDASMRLSSLAALPLILIEKLTPHLVPVQNRVVWVAESFQGDREIVEILEVAFERLPNNLRPASVELGGCCVQGGDNGIGQTSTDLTHEKVATSVNVVDINSMSELMQAPNAHVARGVGALP